MTQHAIGIIHNLMRPFALNMSHKPNAAGIMFKTRVIKADFSWPTPLLKKLLKTLSIIL